MRISNINGTSGNSCTCGSWLDHWKKFSGQTAVYCPVVDCLGKDLVGAHVQSGDTSDRSWYIIPLCNRHNAEMGKSLLVSGVFKLAPANVSQTCARKQPRLSEAYANPIKLFPSLQSRVEVSF